jgi:hypothetical protein
MLLGGSKLPERLPERSGAGGTSSEEVGAGPKGFRAGRLPKVRANYHNP